MQSAWQTPDTQSMLFLFFSQDFWVTELSVEGHYWGVYGIFKVWRCGQCFQSFPRRKITEAQNTMAWELTTPEHGHLRARQSRHGLWSHEQWWENFLGRWHVTNLGDVSGWWCQGCPLLTRRKPWCPSMEAEMGIGEGLVCQHCPWGMTGNVTALDYCVLLERQDQSYLVFSHVFRC